MNQQKPECVYPTCGKEPFKNSKNGYCIYHAEAEDKSEREFKKALKKHLDERNYNFNGFIFVGEIYFWRDFGVNVLKNSNFGGAKFQGAAFLTDTQFQGKAWFQGTEFQQGAYFERTNFQEEAYFGMANFQGGAYFGEANFQGEANFPDTKFHGEANFRIANFQGEASFGRAKFQGETDFFEAAFQENLYFGGTEFRGRTHILPRCIRKGISFFEATLENISLTPLNLDKDAWIDFRGARFTNTQIRREDIENHIRQEQEDDFSGAEEIYLLLKNNFHSLGRYDNESWAFKKERDMQRKSYFHAKRPLRWLGSMFWNLLYGYGERPFWIFGWCGFLLFFSSFIYWLSKGVFHVTGTCLIPVGDYWNNLYFSVVTFTTLGYGDFRPIGTIKVLASIEALLGIFLIALFIFALARRTGGR